MEKRNFDRGVGLKDIRIMTKLTTIARAILILIEERSIWGGWMHVHYVKGIALN